MGEDEIWLKCLGGGDSLLLIVPEFVEGETGSLEVTYKNVVLD